MPTSISPISAQKTSNSLSKLQTEKIWFKDTHGRIVILRGVNLGGDCKVPYHPDGSTHIATDFSHHQDVSFIGRPFPLNDAPEHFKRLQTWGFNCLRLLTTWEAIEHKGPGQFDTAYIDYYGKLVDMALDYGLYIFVDFHQDVWSRMTGGDGAPGWLFEKIGIDYTKLDEANAAITMQRRFNFNDPRPIQEENYPSMCWDQNYKYAGNAIMWTLFFGGRDFAPNFKIDGLNVQDYMQKHYLDSMIQIARRVKNAPNVLGFDSLNEPSPGWIGRAMEDRHLSLDKHDPALPGIAWSPIDGLVASYGGSIQVPQLSLSFRRMGFVPKKIIDPNPNRLRIWLPNRVDPFSQAGAWRLTPESYEILRNDFFQQVGSLKVDFDRDYMFPFIHRVADAVRAINPDWLIFAEKNPMKALFSPNFPEKVPDRLVNATHWYDALTQAKMIIYPFNFDVFDRKLVFGFHGIQNMYFHQLEKIKNASNRVKDGIPTLIGEFGYPFNLDKGKIFQKYARGDHNPKIWQKQNLLFDCTYNAFDALLLNGTLWNYTASNKNDLRIGDHWNQEDLSIFSLDQKENPGDINSGGRALEAIVRPYTRFTQGIPMKMEFHRKTGQFQFYYRANPSIPYPTEIFIPHLQYPNGHYIVAEGTEITSDENAQLVWLRALKSAEIRVTIQRK